jgi:hypothetical protein
MAKEQRRGRRIAMSPEELDAYLGAERTCRIATTSVDGPHNTPLWFVWDGRSIWMQSLVRSQRWIDLERDDRVSVLVDSGHAYGELRGVELRGHAVKVGEVPRVGEPNKELVETERLFARKYVGVEQMSHDGVHAWRRVTPDKITSWDFQKIPAS